MGHDARNPILKRLAKALDTVPPGLVRQFGNDAPAFPDSPADDQALRDWVLRHHRRFGLDPAWILTGGGRPPGDDLHAVARTPVFAMSPINPETGRWRPLAVERIALSPDILAPGRFVVRMDDRAMEPRIRRGAYLVVDPGQVRIPETPLLPPEAPPEPRVFAVDVPGEGLVARFARLVTQANRLELTPLSRDCPPFFMPRGLAEDRVVGRVVWVAQTL